MNTIKTVFFLGLLTGLFLAVGSFWGRNGLVLAFLFAASINFVSYFFSDRIVLSMYRAKPVEPGEFPRLELIVRQLSTKAGIPMPKIYIIPTDSPNAFATGRNKDHAAVAVTRGILKLLDDEELKGVLGHELTHILNRDIMIGTIAATIAGAIMLIANMAKWAFIFGGLRGGDDDDGLIGALLTIIIAPLAAVLIQMAISRSREFKADEGGAHLAGNPFGLANALKKLDAVGKKIPLPASPQTAHLFIMKPFGTRSMMSNLFSTHPPTEKRVERLMRIG